MLWYILNAALDCNRWCSLFVDDPGQEIIIDSPPRVGANLTPGHATYPGSYTGSPGVAHGGATIQQAWPYALPQAQCKLIPTWRVSLLI